MHNEVSITMKLCWIFVERLKITGSLDYVFELFSGTFSKNSDRRNSGICLKWENTRQELKKKLHVRIGENTEEK